MFAFDNFLGPVILQQWPPDIITPARFREVRKNVHIYTPFHREQLTLYHFLRRFLILLSVALIWPVLSSVSTPSLPKIQALVSQPNNTTVYKSSPTPLLLKMRSIIVMHSSSLSA
jgi:hypothetical protein